MRTLPPATRARAAAGALFLVLACAQGEVVEYAAIPPAGSASAEQGPPALNGCLESDFVAARDPLVVVRFGHRLGHNYTPACLRVARGTRIRFEGPMLTHPLEPGRIVESIPIDADGPVPRVVAGDSIEFAADHLGSFGYFCDVHVAEGMMGAIEVVEFVDFAEAAGPLAAAARP